MSSVRYASPLNNNQPQLQISSPVPVQHQQQLDLSAIAEKAQYQAANGVGYEPRGNFRRKPDEAKVFKPFAWRDLSNKQRFDINLKQAVVAIPNIQIGDNKSLVNDNVQHFCSTSIAAGDEVVNRLLLRVLPFTPVMNKNNIMGLTKFIATIPIKDRIKNMTVCDLEYLLDAIEIRAGSALMYLRHMFHTATQAAIQQYGSLDKIFEMRKEDPRFRVDITMGDQKKRDDYNVLLDFARAGMMSVYVRSNIYLFPGFIELPCVELIKYLQTIEIVIPIGRDDSYPEIRNNNFIHIGKFIRKAENARFSGTLSED